MNDSRAAELVPGKLFCSKVQFQLDLEWESYREGHVSRRLSAAIGKSNVESSRNCLRSLGLTIYGSIRIRDVNSEG